MNQETVAATRDFMLLLSPTPRGARLAQLTLNVVGDTLRVEVTDTRRERLPEAQHPCAEEESGHGLLIVKALADRWGVSSDVVPRKTVWAEITVPGL
ncbi:ATP-binding protein [Streptomyces griseofuscus]|uniref:ATP-binding protein n=1 Tax=Streptomyces griseofuscus TaxID=146922 RepID=UPI00343C434A